MRGKGENERVKKRGEREKWGKRGRFMIPARNEAGPSEAGKNVESI